MFNIGRLLQSIGRRIVESSRLALATTAAASGTRQFNGKAERFFKTFRLWQRLTLFARREDWIQRRLDVYRDWYNIQRPMWLHGGRTPQEVWSGITLPQTTKMLERDPIKPAVDVARVNFRGDFHLPTLSIQIIDSVELVA
ncbi:MAG TPA: integrase core domain-containing protein [Planctomycetota bacterium]|nr:integrase core domain-containing protein [Planctomycetota bacterium]